MSALAQRVVTALVLLALLLAAVFLLSSRAFGAALLALVMPAAFEWGRLARYGRRGAVLLAALVTLVCGALLWAPAAGFGAGGWPATVLATVCGAATLFWALVALPWVIARWPLRTPALVAAIGLLLLPAAWMALVQLHALSSWTLLGAMVLVFIADTAAFFSGRRFGRHKLAPLVSPGKTWEGVGGATLAAVVYASACAFAIARAPSPAMIVACVATSVVMLVLAIVGDLFESWLKREAGVKDSGSLLPGHGGVLDRIDALLAAMPPAALAAAAWLR